MLAGIVPASAHNSTSSYMNYTQTDGHQCTYVGDQQNHGGVYLSRYVSTAAMIQSGTRCTAQSEPPGHLAQRGSIYKDGVPCIQGGWQYNDTTKLLLEWQTNDDIWPQCNNGPGVWVTISHDTYHAIPNNYSADWIYSEARPFPSTRHCHCP